MLALLPFLWLGCGSASPRMEKSAQQAIERVIAADAAAGSIRNQAPHEHPIADAVRTYASALRAMDLSATPSEFATAWRAHIAAWEAMVPYLDSHSELRGEMHDLFEQLLGESNPSAEEFRALQNEMWATWGDVETAMKNTGVGGTS